MQKTRLFDGACLIFAYLTFYSKFYFPRINKDDILVIRKGMIDMNVAPTTVCNNILQRALEEHIDVTPMKLQKLLYFVSCEYIKKTNTPLFREEFEVWKYGPVLPSVYSVFSSYGKEPILSYAKDAKGISYIVDEDEAPALKASIETIWQTFKNWNAVALSQITHREGSAWSYFYDRYENTIKSEMMKEDHTYEEFICA